jgi:hypothetical protein
MLQVIRHPDRIQMRTTSFNGILFQIRNRKVKNRHLASLTHIQFVERIPEAGLGGPILFGAKWDGLPGMAAYALDHGWPTATASVE